MLTTTKNRSVLYGCCLVTECQKVAKHLVRHLVGLGTNFVYALKVGLCLAKDSSMLGAKL